MARRLQPIVVLFTVAAAVLAQDAKPNFDKARESFRTAVRKGVVEECEGAIGLLLLSADPRGIEDLLTALRASENKVEKLRDEADKTGKELREAWKVVDQSASKTGSTTQGALDQAQKKASEINAKLEKLAAELRDAEALSYLLRDGAGQLIAGLEPARRSAEAAKLAEAVVKAKEPADRSSFVRVLGEAGAAEARDALVELLARSDDPAVRVAVIDALVRRVESAAIPAVAKALEDEAWTVRATAAKALGSFPTLDGVPALIAAMAKVEGRVLDEVVASLEDLTGLTRHDNAVLWQEWWAKDGETLRKISADVLSAERDVRTKAYEAAVEKGLLVVARQALAAEGLVPERDEDARAPQRRPAQPVLAAAEATAASNESDLRRAVFGKLIQSRPKLIRERAVARLFLSPYRRTSGEAEDFATAAAYAPFAAGLTAPEVMIALEKVSGDFSPHFDPAEKNAVLKAAKQRRRAAHDLLRKESSAAMSRIRAAQNPVAGPVGKPQKPTSGPTKPGGEDEIDPRTGLPRPSTSFYGIQTRSKRVLYILDVSGSMSFEQAKTNGKLPIQTAKEELTQSIRSLPEDAVFNIVFFSSEVFAWKEKPVKADKAGKTEASAWIAAREAVGATNIFDAIEKGFQLAGRGTHDKRYSVAVDTIFFLSDGRANRGRLVEPAQIVAETRRLNSEQKLKIHCVGIGKDHDPALMRALAELSGGTYVAK